MNDNTQKAFVHSSLEALKRAALNVLYETQPDGYIQQDKVRKRLGIPKVEEQNPARHNSLIYGILTHLLDDEYAIHLSGFGWKITEKGVKVIEG